MTRIRFRSVALALAITVVAGPAQAVRLVAWGDSLTAGNDWLGQLDDLGYDWSGIDQGLAGEHSWDAADGIVSGPSDTRRFRNWLESDYEQQPDDVFVLFWGTNDVVRIDWAGDGVPDGDFAHPQTRAALAQMADDALALSVPVVLVVPPPFAFGEDSPHSQADVDLFNSNIEMILRTDVFEIAAERRAGGEAIAVADAYDHWLGLPGWPSLDYYRLANDFADGVHPGTEPGPSGASGRYHLAEAIAPAVVEAMTIPEPGTLLLAAGGLAAMAASRRRQVARRLSAGR
jgi:lysophospholipase L1-like esterase